MLAVWIYNLKEGRRRWTEGEREGGRERGRVKETMRKSEREGVRDQGRDFRVEKVVRGFTQTDSGGRLGVIQASKEDDWCFWTIEESFQ